RRRSPADEHPPGRPRRPRTCPRLLPGRGSRALRLHAHAARNVRAPDRPRPLRGGAGARLVCTGFAAAAAPRPAERGLRRGDGGDLPAPARPDRAAPRARAAGAAVAARLGEGLGRSPGRGGAMTGQERASVAVVGGGLAGITAALELAG